MPQFSIYLTELQDRLLKHTVANPTDWIDNLVEWRVRIAEDDYLPTAIAQLEASGATSIPGTRDEIILAVELPPKDPNWTPIERDDPNDDRTVLYTFDLEEDDLKMLAWMYENPHEHIIGWVTERCNIAIQEKAALVKKELLADPTWTAPIPLDPIALLDLVKLKTVADHLEESGASIREMHERMENGESDYVPPAITIHDYHHQAAPDTGAGPA
jgi:hypothetical protein